eukprot:TRINITY_DN27476_c0_g1_i2.p1 TRINITY_DN27476_c0_g1~~TRINITY_DN27476_c0_g1_i2.p1  ORF type:complete len:593 (+),score=98.62 TRINITY_DN27476_c0_g1_i2:92-1870(+)
MGNGAVSAASRRGSTGSGGRGRAASLGGRPSRPPPAPAAAWQPASGGSGHASSRCSTSHSSREPQPVPGSGRLSGRIPEEASLAQLWQSDKAIYAGSDQRAPPAVRQARQQLARAALLARKQETRRQAREAAQGGHRALAAHYGGAHHAEVAAALAELARSIADPIERENTLLRAAATAQRAHDRATGGAAPTRSTLPASQRCASPPRAPSPVLVHGREGEVAWHADGALQSPTAVLSENPASDSCDPLCVLSLASSADGDTDWTVERVLGLVYQDLARQCADGTVYGCLVADGGGGAEVRVVKQREGDVLKLHRAQDAADRILRGMRRLPGGCVPAVALRRAEQLHSQLQGAVRLRRRVLGALRLQACVRGWLTRRGLARGPGGTPPAAQPGAGVDCFEAPAEQAAAAPVAVPHAAEAAAPPHTEAGAAAAAPPPAQGTVVAPAAGVAAAPPLLEREGPPAPRPGVAPHHVHPSAPAPAAPPPQQQEAAAAARPPGVDRGSASAPPDRGHQQALPQQASPQQTPPQQAPPQQAPPQQAPPQQAPAGGGASVRAASRTEERSTPLIDELAQLSDEEWMLRMPLAALPRVPTP